MLLAFRADVNSTNYIGLTPLHYAAMGGKGDVVRATAGGADVNPRNKNGNTPLAKARSRLDDGGLTDEERLGFRTAMELLHEHSGHA